MVVVASNGTNAFNATQPGYTLLATANGGSAWTTVVPSLAPPGADLVDPQIATVPAPLNVYAQNTDAIATFDRSEQVYVVMDEHNAAYTSGAIVLEKFDFSGSDPGTITQTIADKVLYQWNGSDAAYNPTIAVDNNDPIYTDPQAHAVQTDTMATMHMVTGEPANPYEGDMVPKAVYVAWNTINNAPTNPDPRSASGADFNGVVQSAAAPLLFNPSMIKIMASSDGGNAFTTPENVNDSVNFQGLPVPSPDYAVPSGSPQIVFTQGNVSGTVPGGEMAIVWSNLTYLVAANGSAQGGGFYIDTSFPDAGAASQPAAEADVVAGTGGPITDGTFPGTTSAGAAVPDIPGVTKFPITVNITDPHFTLADLSVSLAAYLPHMNQISMVLEAPDGTMVTLINNYTDALGNNGNNAAGVQVTGLPDKPNLGIDNASVGTNTGPFPAYNPGQVDDVTFDQQASRAINDPSVTEPIAGYFRPDDMGMPSAPGAAGMGLNVFQGWTPMGEPVTGAHALNGTWTLIITDFRNDRLGMSGQDPNHNQNLDNWSLDLTAYISTTSFGTDTPVPLATLTGLPKPNNDVPGAANDNYLNKEPATPTVGIGPTFSVAVDNTLGSFSPYQGRIYIAATTPGVNSLNPPDTDIMLVYSDDGGMSFDGGPIRVNDDTVSDGTTGVRSQFMPSLSVDLATGTLVATYFDARADSADARVVTSIQASIDGGNTWSTSTYLNPQQTATDTITGNADVVGPIPTNIGAAGALGVGDRQSVTVYGGNVYAFWSGNLNTAGITTGGINSGGFVITTARATIAGGPRVLSGNEGPVTQTGSTGTYDNTFTSDGTRQLTAFEVQFDRPVDPGTVNPSSVQISYLNPSTPAGQPGTNLSSQITAITPLDINTTPNPPSVSIGNALVLEGAGAVAVFPVLLTVPGPALILTVTTGDITAKEGINFSTPAATVTIPAGAQSAFITVPILVDPTMTGNETFAVNIALPTGSGDVLHRGQAVGTIVDADSPRNLSISDGIALKSTAGIGMVFTVVLNQPYFQDVTVHYATADGTAVAGRDYVATSGYVTIPAGKTTGTIVVPIINNTVYNNNLNFTVALDTPPIGIALSPTNATGTGIIVDDVTQFPLTVNVGDGIVDKPHSGVTNLYIPVVLSIPQTTDILVTFSTANDSAVAGTDYVATSGTLDFQAGQSTAMITVQVLGNLLQEGNRDFFVNLTSVSGGVTLGITQGKGTIVESNYVPALTIANATAQSLSTANTTIVFPVYLSIPSTQAITFSYATVDGTAAAGTDYTATSGTIMVPAGMTSAAITVQVLPDQKVANDLTFFVNLFGATGATTANQQATGTIVDSTLGLSIGDTSLANPQTGMQAMVFTVYLNGPTSNPVSVKYATANAPHAGTAEALAGTDYVATSGTLNFAPGQTSATISVTVDGTLMTAANDLSVNKVFFVNLSNPLNANLLKGQAVGTIVDDNAVPTLTVGNVLVRDGDTSDATPQSALVPVYVSYPIQQNITVAYTLMDGTGVDAAVGGTDYVSHPGTVTIMAGTSSATITVPIIPTMSYEEPDLTFTVNLGAVSTDRPGTTLPNAVIAPSPAAPAAAVNYGQGTVTIVHHGVSINVGDPTIINPPAGGTSPTTIVFPVFLSGPRSVPVTFSWSTADGTGPDAGMAGRDYTTVPSTMAMIPAGTTQTNLTVTVLSAPTISSDATFFVNIDPTTLVGADPRPGVSKLQGEAIIFHTNGNAAATPLPVEVSAGNVTQLEGNAGTSTFAIPVVINQSAAATVDFTVASGTAVPGTDYVTMGTMGTLTFTTGGPQEQFVNVEVIGNTIDNQATPDTSGNRAFEVVLSNPMGTGIEPGFVAGTGTIVDDDALTATIGDATVLKPQSGTVGEVFTVLLSNISPNPVNLQVSTANLTALAPGDYKPLTDVSLNIPANTPSATFTVTVNGNTLQEGNTQFTVSVPKDNQGNFTISGAAVAKGTATGTIVDQNTIALTVGDVAITDGPAGTTSTLVFPVYLNSATSNTVTVHFATQDETALSTGTTPDYVPTAGTLTFMPGATTAFVTVTVNGNASAEPNKQFIVNLSNAQGAGLLQRSATLGTYGIGTIINDNMTPGVTIGDGAVPKEAAGTTSAMVFPVYLSYPVSQAITVSYDTEDASATVGYGNYVPVTGGTVVIPLGTTSASITVTVNGSSTPEGNQDFLVNYFLPYTGTVVTGRLPQAPPPGDMATATGLIVDTNKLATVNVGDVILDKAPSLPTTVVFPVLLSNPLAYAASVQFATADGTAVAGTNYLATSGTLVFPAGSTMEGITVTVLGNSYQEGNKDFFVNLGGAFNATIAKPQATGTIVDSAGPIGASKYLVSIAPQSAVGTYSYAVGPFVSDRIRTDVPTIEAVPGTNATIYSPPPSQVGLAVPALAATAAAPLAHTDSTMTISGVPSSLEIRDMTVNLSIAYPLADHLMVDLIAPDGMTNVWLTANNQLPNLLDPSHGDLAPPTVYANYLNTTFDDTAAPSITDWNVVPPFDGSFRPGVDPLNPFVPTFLFTPTPLETNSLSTFKGLSPDGTWTLRVYAADPLTGASDPLTPAAGVIQSWSMTIQTGVPNLLGSPGNYMDQNSDGVTVDQARSNLDIFAVPQQTNGVPYQQLPNPVTLPDGSTATATAPAPFQLPYVSNSLPLIIPGPYAVPLSFYPSPNPGSLAPIPNPVPLNLPIPDAVASGTNVTAGTLNSTISITNVPVGQVISDLTVTVSIDHPQVSDLVLTLIAPDGTQVTLSNRNPVQLPSASTLLEYLPGSNFDDVTFDDNAPERGGVPALLSAPAGATVPNFLPPYTGSYLPQSPLSVLNGKSLNGTWTLQIQDMAPGNTGTLLGWSLQAQNGEVLNANASSVDINFDTLINPATFKPANVLRIMGPVGPVPLTNPTTGLTDITITPILPSGAPDGSLSPAPEHEFRIGFPTQTASGNYSVQIGPNPVTGAYIESTSGNAVDTNQNAGLPLLEGEDQSTTATIPITNATTAAPVKVVPGGPLALMPLTVPNNFVIQGVQVTVNIAATYDQALEGVLYAPNGTAVTLFTAVGSGPVNGQSGFQNTTFNDAAATPIQEGVTPFNTAPGSYNPQKPLSVLDGTGSRGTWYLGILSAATARVGNTTVVNPPGQITSWSLTLQQSPTTNTGLGEPVADQIPLGFELFIASPTAPQATTQWTPVGPADINNQQNASTVTSVNEQNVGRITALAVDPSDPSGNTVYAGGASGGIWKTTNFLTNDPRGPNWIPLTDFGPTFSLNIGAIVVVPKNNDPLQSIIIAATGEGNTLSPGVGFLRSPDGGKTWQVLDSLNNIDPATGNVASINSPSRDHTFVGTTAYNLIADVPNPAKYPTSAVILYAAMGDTPTSTAGLPSSNNGGIYRSTNLGNTWTLVQAGNATDVQLAAGSAGANGNLQVLYGAFKGVGVGFTSNATVATSMSLLPTPGNVPQQDNLLENDSNYPTVAIFPVALPASTPSGPPGSVTPEGRITLAVPKATGQPLLDSFYQSWVYAIVATPGSGGTLVSLYMSKDFGRTWTQILIPIAGGLPTNDYTQPEYDPLATSKFPQANYNISLTVDPSNPNVIYVGGVDYAQPQGGLIRIDTTLISDPYAYVPYNNSKNDGGLTMTSTVGDALKYNPGIDVDFGVADPYTLPPYTPSAATEQYTGENPTTGAGGFFNLQRNPEDPFITFSTVRGYGIGQPSPANMTAAFTNTGQGAPWIAYEEGMGNASGDLAYFDIVAVPDPLTGATRLIFGTSLGVYTQVADATGELIPGIGTATDPSGSRNGNLQVTQFIDGAVQPSELATELAGALFYGSARENGEVASGGNILQNGNQYWSGPTGDATGVGTDQTGSGTKYQYLWPSFFTLPGQALVGGLPSDFFQVTKAGAPSFSATNGLVVGTTNPAQGVGQWPLPTFPVGSSYIQPPGGAMFAVNPVDGNGIVMSSPNTGDAGWVYLTTSGGANWFPIAQPTDLDSTYAQAMAFGAPNPSDPPGSLDNIIYAGTTGGNIFVTFTGGGVGTPWKSITGGAFGSTGALDGSAVQQIVPDTHRGSHDLYAVTLNGVYYMADSTALNPTWVNITGNLFTTALAKPIFGDPAQQQNTLVDMAGARTYLTSIAVDWRFAIPNDPTKPTGPTHPVLYVGGEAGVFRSLDMGKTWTDFPDTADGALVNGGYLPDAHVTALSLALGNIDPNSGQPINQGTGFDMLVATTYGRGQFEIRLNTQAQVSNVPIAQYAVSPVEGPYVVTAGLVNTSGASVSAIDVTFSGPVDPSTFTLAQIKQIIGPAGNSITPLVILDISTGAAGSDIHNMYQIQFAPQTTVGVYTITLGPQISDFAGNQMDQNRNGINGQAVGDDYSGAFFFGTSPNPAVAPPPVPEVVTRIINNGQWWVGTPNGTNALTFNQFGQWAVDSPGLTWVNVHVGDLLGNGTDDIVGMVKQTGQWWVGISNGDHFTNELWATWAPYTATFQWQDVVFGDFTGDGKMDIAGRESGNGKWWVAVSTGHSFVTSFWTAWTPDSPSFTWVDVVVGDFNGDGKADIAGRVMQTGQWWVNISNGSTFTTKFWGAWAPDNPGTLDWVNVMVGDFTGNGKDDIVGRILENGEWWMNLSTGSVFKTTFWDQWSPAVTWVDVQAADVKGNGRSDIVGRAQELGDYFVSVSSGTGGQTSLWAQFGTDALGNLNWEADTVLGDLTGNGEMDLISWDQALSEWWVALANPSGTAFGPRALWANFPGTTGFTLVDTTTAHVR